MLFSDGLVSPIPTYGFRLAANIFVFFRHAYPHPIGDQNDVPKLSIYCVYSMYLTLYLPTVLCTYLPSATAGDVCGICIKYYMQVCTNISISFRSIYIIYIYIWICICMCIYTYTYKRKPINIAHASTWGSAQMPSTIMAEGCFSILFAAPQNTHKKWAHPTTYQNHPLGASESDFD